MNGTKPKLVIFSHICSPISVTGAEKLLLLFARELVRRFQCVMVVPQQGIIAEKAKELGVRIVVQEIPLCISLYTAASTIVQEIADMQRHPSWGRIHALLEEERPDCVLVNTTVHPLPAMAAKAKGIPTLWVLMETVMDRASKQTSVELVASNCDLVIGISHSTLQPIRELAPHARTFLLSPYLIREELLPGSWPYHRMRLRQQYGWGEHHRVAGFLAATIYSNKGLEPFVKAMLPIAASDGWARFLIQGKSADDAYYRHCQKLVRDSGYADRFLFLPFADQIQHAFPVMDVVVVPSLIAEGFGMTALEGLMFGKGVVAASSGGLEEIMNATGNQDYLVPPGDVGRLSEKVSALLGNGALLRAVGERNMQISQQVFGLEAFRQRLADLMAELPQTPVLARGPLWRGSEPTVYLVENGIKQPFASEETFLRRGFRFEEVTDVPEEDLQRLPSGPMLVDPGSGESPKPKPSRGKGRGIRRKKRRSGGRRARLARRRARLTGRRVRSAAGRRRPARRRARQRTRKRMGASARRRRR
ncbi:glycosyltransferase family 4 protein [Cohnella hongkongensis]|uniref:Glycosyltransferase family 4 protein n=1 Tax=Cohnella hongkongensis TaxID=178337 RepID=A0ABV9FA81_9BACL